MPEQYYHNTAIPNGYGENVFSVSVMKGYLSAKAYNSLIGTMKRGEPLDSSIADEVASSMKRWALDHGATHFTHWFQPLTGSTAEKHESFFNPINAGGALAQFSATELIQGEPDASSFPSGGLRATFEARGYTAWDPTSPAFITNGPNDVRVLCIPSIFCGYYGEALDKKTPLIRSQAALADQILRIAKILGIEGQERPYATLGPEQEYFLVDIEHYKRRPDLMQTGRTLVGRRPARHQQLEDHYFGQIKPRVLKYMAEVDRELWKLGIPAKTRHNEVSPAQFELAPVFEEQNLAIDHNMLTMQVLRDVANRHGFTCLLHEKPFAGVNGSGKHNNWSIVGPDGKNWLTPGSTPHDNVKFLIMLCAFIKGVDTFSGVLRASVCGAGNDHRLGGNEAPPVIMSIFLGEQLTDIIQQLEHGDAKRSKKSGHIKIGISTLPELRRDDTDRNRTAPIAFTGNKFEFRAVGSSQSSSNANFVLNTIMSYGIDALCTAIENNTTGDLHTAIQTALSGCIKMHKKILFDGDGYADSWVDEAHRRGLPDLRTTPEALESYIKPETLKLFENFHVLSEKEQISRYEVYNEGYIKTIVLEAECLTDMVRTLILPASLTYVSELGSVLNAAKGLPQDNTKALLKDVMNNAELLQSHVIHLEKICCEKINAPAILDLMLKIRKHSDYLEGLIPHKLWPLATYAELFFDM